MSSARWAGVVVALLAALFALQGGEYSTFQWLDLRRQEREERARVASLQRVVDSLSRYARQVETDPETQERIAREQHGMLKKGEHAFFLEEGPDDKP